MSNIKSTDLFDEKSPDPHGEDFLIVGIGASAGGIQALKKFFKHVPPDSGMAYVVILHLSPNYESKLAEVLQSTATIPVTQVTESVLVRPDNVYVVSPNKSLAMTDGQLLLSETIGFEERRAPVDIFFRTLGETHHSRAVCVVLSGTGANGSMGIKRVKECGGVCIVQDPLEAEYGDMPRNSLATGLVDYILPVAEIPTKILSYKNHLGVVSIPIEPEDRRDEDERALREIFTQLRVRTGHDFTNYKRSTVLRRIARRINVHQLSGLSEYASHIRENADEARALLKDLLISVTNFFRDAEQFRVLERDIIPRLFQNKKSGDQVRVWVAGCATGEEAYSMGMLLTELVDNAPSAPSVQIFATDIDEHAVAKARDGVYTINDAADISPERLRRFFSNEGKGYRVRQELREMILFATHNVIKDPPFSHLDMVSCRNLLIYLNKAAQERVTEVVHFALNPEGFLFLGNSESIEGTDLFTPFDKEHHVYQARPVESRLTLTAPNIKLSTERRIYQQQARPELQLPQQLSNLDLHQRLLEQYAGPSVVINEDYEIVHLSEKVGKYMQIVGGEPSLNLLKVLRPELRLVLRTALYQAMKKRSSTEVRRVRVQTDNRIELLRITVKPVLRSDDPLRGLVLIVFEQESDQTQDTDLIETISPSDEPIARQLEEELMQIKVQLRTTSEQYEVQHEELKASNEELQAMNEELRSSSEELETSKEELESVNEELITVNQELKVKIEELSQSNNDLQNLMNSTDIGTIFLDRSLRVKLFTPRASDIFSLIPADVGGPLTDLNSRLRDKNVIADLDAALDSRENIVREVATTDDCWFLMRALPYRTSEQAISGVVLTFLDITKLKRAHEETRRSEERFRRAIEIDTVGIVFFDNDGRITDCNDAFLRMSGYSRTELNPGLVREDAMTPNEWVKQTLPGVKEFTETGRTEPYEKEFVRKDGSRWRALFAATRISEKEGVQFIIDITEHKETQENLAVLGRDLERRLAEHSEKLATRTRQLEMEVLERKQIEGERNESLRRLATAQEDERRRMARDLHDQMGQQLTALRLQLETLKARMVEDEKVYDQIERTQVLVRQIETDIDFLAWELRPLTLDDLGLPSAINELVKRWSEHASVAADFHCTGLDKLRLAPEIETNLYRIAQEALTNVRKHAKAKRVEVILERRENHIVLVVEDDGKGSVRAGWSTGQGMGLAGMRERAAHIGGTVEIESTPDQGTTIFARMPAVFIDVEEECIYGEDRE